MTSEIEVDVLNDRIPEEQRGRGKATEERWYCQLWAHKDLPCALVGEPNKPKNEPGVRHYPGDYETTQSRYAKKVLEARKLQDKLVEVAKTPRPVEDLVGILNPEVMIRPLLDVAEDQHETVAIKGELLGTRKGLDKLAIKFPWGVEYIDAENVLGVVVTELPPEPSHDQIITHSNGSGVWRWLRDGWLDVSNARATPMPWRTLWLRYKDKLQVWSKNEGALQ